MIVACPRGRKIILPLCFGQFLRPTATWAVEDNLASFSVPLRPGRWKNNCSTTRRTSKRSAGANRAWAVERRAMGGLCLGRSDLQGRWHTLHKAAQTFLQAFRSDVAYFGFFSFLR